MADEKDQKNQTEEQEEEKKAEELKEAPEASKKESKEEIQEESKEEKKEKPKEKPAPTGRFKDIIKQIEELSVKDLADLVKELEDRFGVSAAAAVIGTGGAAAGTAPTNNEVEEKTEYTIMLTDAGAQKIAVIKAIREIRPDLGLKEAKDLVDGAPKEVKSSVPTDEANVAKSKLEAVGAKVELK